MFLTAEYLMGRVVVLPKGCWEWTGAKSKDGYGILRVEGKQVVARRIFWLMFRSEIQEGQVLRQRLKPPRCIGHLCCNPDHLEIRDVHGPIWEMCPNQHRLVPRNTIVEKQPGGASQSDTGFVELPIGARRNPGKDRIASVCKAF